MIKILKISLSVFLAASLCAAAFSETKKADGFEFGLKASRDGSEYKSGETAEFLLTAKDANGMPLDGIKVVGEITKDSVPMGGKFSGEIKNGKFLVKGTLNEAGFLKCAVFFKTPPSSKNPKGISVDLLAGAAFSPLEIKPSLPAPDDFDEYWAKQKAILAAIPANVKLTPVKSASKGVKTFDVQADSFNGKLSAYLVIPENAKPKSLPAMLFCQGAGVRSSNLYTDIWAKRGFITLDFNAHGLPNGQPAEFYRKLAANELKDYSRKNCENRDEIFFRTLFLRLLRAIDVLTARPEWDGKHLIVQGGSQGGGQALAAGALSDKVNVVCALFPAICDHGGAAIGRTTGWPHFTRLDANGNYNKKAVEATRYFDCVNFAARIKCPVFYMINYADNVCEPTTGYAAYNNIKAPKRLWINEESRHAPARGTYDKVIMWGVDEIAKDGVKFRTIIRK